MPSFTAPPPFPPRAEWGEITAAEWDDYVAVCVAATDRLLRVHDRNFNSGDDRIVSFLASYLSVYSTGLVVAIPSDSRPPTTSGDVLLRKNVFMLLHRIFVSMGRISSPFLTPQFLGQMGVVFSSSSLLSALFTAAWSKRRDEIEANLAVFLSSILSRLGKTTKDISQMSSVRLDLGLLAGLVRSSVDASKIVLSGTDLIEALIDVFPDLSSEMQQIVGIITHKGLLGLATSPSPAFSVLADQLYLIKSRSPLDKPAEMEKSLLVHVLSHTSFLDDLDLTDTRASRARATIDSIRHLRRSGANLDKQPQSGTAVSSEVEAGIGQLRDLFPDIGTGFAARVLEFYSANVEQATAALLDGNLPPHLTKLDRLLPLDNFHRNRPVAKTTKLNAAAPAFKPTSIPAAVKTSGLSDERLKAVFGTEKAPKLVHFGGTRLSQDALTSVLTGVELSDKSAFKAAILAALTRQAEEEEDETDERYEGGYFPTGQSAGPSRGRAAVLGDDGDADDNSTDAPASESSQNKGKPPISQAEIAAFTVWKANPAVFERTSSARTSKERAALRATTKWPDHRLEDWASLLTRDAKKQAGLQSRLSDPLYLGGAQSRTIGRTSWRSSTEEDDDGNGQYSGPAGRTSSAGGTYRGSSNFRSGRGRGQGRGGSQFGSSRRAQSGPGGNVDQSRPAKDASSGRASQQSRKPSRAGRSSRSGER